MPAGSAYRPRKPLLLGVALLLLSLHGRAQTGHSLSWGREAGVVGAGVAFHGISLLQAGKSMPVWTGPLDPSGVPAVDRTALGRWDPGMHRGSNVLFGAAVGVSLATAVLAPGGERSLVPAVIVLESGFLAAGMTEVVKEAVRRPRPYLYRPAIPMEEHQGREDHHAFWSGHTADIAAVTFATAHLVQRSEASPGTKTAVWVGAATVPAAMGWMRVRSGRHFPTDVLTGYAFGALVGWAVPYLHRRGKGGRSSH